MLRKTTIGAASEFQLRMGLTPHFSLRLVSKETPKVGDWQSIKQFLETPKQGE
jgi:hypothetical protein